MKKYRDVITTRNELAMRCPQTFGILWMILKNERTRTGSKCCLLSSRRRHTRYWRDWSSDVCSSDLAAGCLDAGELPLRRAVRRPLLLLRGGVGQAGPGLLHPRPRGARRSARGRVVPGRHRGQRRGRGRSRHPGRAVRPRRRAGGARAHPRPARSGLRAAGVFPPGSLQGVAGLRDVRTRSISPENLDGSPGGGARATEGTGAACARDIGPGWKISPSVDVAAGSTLTLAEIEGPAVITHLWVTVHRDHWRELVLRAYWDGDDEPAVEVPYGDFFCSGWGVFAQVSSQLVAANPNGGFNSYWPMPFRAGARLTLENTA